VEAEMRRLLARVLAVVGALHAARSAGVGNKWRM
jgi:hypothetical protein